MTHEDYKGYIEAWDKELQALRERRKKIDQMYVNANKEFIQGTPVELTGKCEGIDPGVYVTTGDYFMFNDQIRCGIIGAGWSVTVPQDMLKKWNAKESELI